ncbi:alkylation response protein AidB-like acyl-CoA dehydrogenase [Nonomuraea thailandensis]|uniref:Alkylation response protein AidB-like acyl-CoA dehydrogenase n=1 Tax=Nonomuraea thailandensis TaxID=1188745 RepID=A0A9X2GJF8_9ACTN|nr:acyl-CoA dehydrogenase family protein [Nonomuraea thailandensis]MCP2358850.1 alkylation response protein AidB-like acyl-CoA dehydrogenase [Nonomuraea thailandensis]
MRDEDSFEEMLTELARRREEFRELRYVPKDFVDRLKRLGLYRVSTPRRFGGEPMPPAEFLRMIERVSAVDGSTGWVASFGSQLVYLGSLPLETQAALYADGPDVVLAGGLFPVQEAVPTERGFRLNGRWKFASGCMAADVLVVGIPGDDSTSGKPRGALVRPERLEIVREWDVVGMQGTGSFDLVARDVEIGREWTFIRGGAPVIDEPLYRYPAITYAAQSLSVVSAGVARAALDLAEGEGSGRGSITGAPRLADRPYYRAGIAGAEAALRSARAYFYEAAQEAWQALADGGEVGDEQNAHLRLSAAHLARTAAEVVGKVVSLSGTAAIYRDHPLQALLGDALVPQEHAFLSPAMYDAAGAVLMGLPPTVPAFR